MQLNTIDKKGLLTDTIFISLTWSTGYLIPMKTYTYAQVSDVCNRTHFRSVNKQKLARTRKIKNEFKMQKYTNVFKLTGFVVRSEV